MEQPLGNPPVAEYEPVPEAQAPQASQSLKKSLCHSAHITSTEAHHLFYTMQNDIHKAVEDEYNAAPASSARRPANAGVQAVPVYSLHEVNTTTATLMSSGMSHTDGCWPRDVDPTDGEQVARWRKRVERDEYYIKTALHLGAVVEELVKQNNALDIYKDFFANSDIPALEPPSVFTLAALRHPLGLDRSVQSISWCPNGSGNLAVAFGHAASSGPEGGLCTVFDISTPLSPTITLTAPSSVGCLAYNLKEHSLVAGGQRSGQTALFDLRAGAEPTGQTCPRLSHADAITGLTWMQCKSGTEFMTVSSDGSAAWWDCRRLTERLDTVPVREKSATTGTGADGTAAASPPLEGTCMEYSVAAGPTKFMIGTVLGNVLSGNWRAKSPADRFSASFSGHHGPVRAISRHPTFSKYFITVGDWTTRLWAEDVKTPLMTTPYGSQYKVAGAWSSTRPSVFYTLGSEGAYEAWDLLRSHKTPVLSASVADAPPTTLAVDGKGKCLQAVGCADGATVVVQPAGCLAQASEDESAAMLQMLEMECGRERALEKAEKEAKARTRREAAKAAETVTRISPGDLDKLEREFMAEGLMATAAVAKSV